MWTKELCGKCLLNVVVDEHGVVRVEGEPVGRVGDTIKAIYPPACMVIDEVSGESVVKDGCKAVEAIGGN